MQHTHRRQHRCGTAHIHLHGRVAGIGRLERNATGVIHNPLTNKRDGANRLARTVGELDHACRFDRALIDAQHAAKAHRGHVVVVEYLDAELGFRGHLEGDIGHVGGVQVAGRGVGEITRETHRVANSCTALRALIDRRQPSRGRDKRDFRELYSRLRVLLVTGLRPMFGEPVAGHSDTFGNGLTNGTGVTIFGINVGQGRGNPLVASDRSGHSCRRGAHTVDGEIASSAHTDGDDDRTGC